MVNARQPRQVRRKVAPALHRGCGSEAGATLATGCASLCDVVRWGMVCTLVWCLPPGHWRVVVETADTFVSEVKEGRGR